MSTLFTKNGRPLQLSGDKLYSRSGRYVGQIRGRKVFAPIGRYAGTVVGERVIYRSTDSASVSGLSTAANRVGSARANRVGSALWGDEPPFPD